MPTKTFAQSSRPASQSRCVHVVDCETPSDRTFSSVGTTTPTQSVGQNQKILRTSIPLTHVSARYICTTEASPPRGRARAIHPQAVLLAHLVTSRQLIGIITPTTICRCTDLSGVSPCKVRMHTPAVSSVGGKKGAKSPKRKREREKKEPSRDTIELPLRSLWVVIRSRIAGRLSFRSPFPITCLLGLDGGELII